MILLETINKNKWRIYSRQSSIYLRSHANLRVHTHTVPILSNRQHNIHCRSDIYLIAFLAISVLGIHVQRFALGARWKIAAWYRRIVQWTVIGFFTIGNPFFNRTIVHRLRCCYQVAYYQVLQQEISCKCYKAIIIFRKL